MRCYDRNGGQSTYTMHCPLMLSHMVDPPILRLLVLVPLTAKLVRDGVSFRASQRRGGGTAGQEMGGRLVPKAAVGLIAIVALPVSV